MTTGLFCDHIVRQSSATREPSFQAVIVDNQEVTQDTTNEEGQGPNEAATILGQWHGNELGFKTRIQPRPQTGFTIRFTNPHTNRPEEDIAYLYLPSDIIQSLNLQKTVPGGTELQANQIYGPTELHNHHPSFAVLLATGTVWKPTIGLQHHRFHDADLLNRRTFGDQAEAVNQIRTYLRGRH
ncbi:hypothetical protein BDW62DRAFT_200020 [Aspergillus aurantiobrunneus]